MKYSPSVCRSTLAFATIVFSLASAASAQSPALAKGVSVQMAVTTGAAAFPEADNQDAWIVAVTADGSLYFGVKPVTLATLTEEMKSTPRRREARLYVKADARARFDAVKQALHAAQRNLFETAVLLTEQQQPAADGAIVPPQGLEVSLALPSTTATVVALYNSGQPSPGLKVNDQEFSWSALETALTAASEGGRVKQVVLEADGSLPFDQIVKVIDVSRSLGAKVALSLAGL
jgi:biopolymer transport protein ExbD